MEHLTKDKGHSVSTYYIITLPFQWPVGAIIDLNADTCSKKERSGPAQLQTKMCRLPDVHLTTTPGSQSVSATIKMAHHQKQNISITWQFASHLNDWS